MKRKGEAHTTPGSGSKFRSGWDNPTNASRGFYVETTVSTSFQRGIHVVCLYGSSYSYFVLFSIGIFYVAKLSTALKTNVKLL